MSEPTLYILCGLPFAGKTTLAKELVKHFGFVHIVFVTVASVASLASLVTDFAAESLIIAVLNVSSSTRKLDVVRRNRIRKPYLHHL
jgi:broad-specificity NMP kinase